MDGLTAVLALIVMIPMSVVEIEHVEEIPDRRHVFAASDLLGVKQLSRAIERILVQLATWWEGLTCVKRKGRSLLHRQGCLN